ncbi:TlpA disulfide reductase family protein [Sutcliffiella rhizosphaerae]|uniref:Thiol-disulfide oxidoreductase ResA n=1 Tax=Sutcliffiella rhizosphaerae TaxID=2880967 RepID=A0ABN8ABK3_9BACI|nr:TlpA disulfide reductase family protein [Sutcliffiella rhizosphaerae]CAG9620393.1 Thiol-disulfide oxidoreductase ResA [Sutcliffiella rhizosphaerae]
MEFTHSNRHYLSLCAGAVYTHFNSPKHATTSEEDSIAYDFTLSTLTGDTITLSDLRGKPVILNFWATWCDPCKDEMPVFEEFYQTYGEEVQILAINITSNDSEKKVRNFVEEHYLTFPILLDTEGIFRHYQVLSMPTSFFINKDGQIVDIAVGELTMNRLLEQSEKIRE